MRVIMMVCSVLLAGCVSGETRQLAQGVHRYQVKQAAVVGELASSAYVMGVVSAADRAKIVANQQALSEATGRLSKILGEPKVSVEVDSW